MKIVPCKKVCIECGFMKGSQVGVLQPEIIDYINTQTLFPCHMDLKRVTGSENTGIELYKATQDECRVCRGYLECMVKSGVEPRYELLRAMFEEVSLNMTDGIMNLEETLKYHGRA